MIIQPLHIENLNEIMALTQHLNPEKSSKILSTRQTEMFAFNNYVCLGAFVNEQLIGVSSGWITVRLYSGKQLEVDNVIIDPSLQSSGLGAQFLELLEDWASENGCKTVELNTYVQNGRSHKFYFKQGYEILGFHFQKKYEEVIMEGYYHTPESVKEYIHLAKDVSGIKLIEQIEPYLNASSTLLELGSGPGTDYEILSRNYDVTGSDYSLEFLKGLVNKFPKGKFLHIDASSIKLEDSYDLIYSNKVLHHLTDEQLVDSFKSQKEILNPSGLVAHSFWKGEDSEMFKGMFVNYHSQKELVNEYLNGFEIILMNEYHEFEPNDSIFIVAKKVD